MPTCGLGLLAVVASGPVPAYTQFAYDIRQVLEGKVFAGRFRVLRQLGAGAMGAVYEVVDIDTDRRRALKVMHAPVGDRPADGERWKSEAKIVGAIDSRFIVDVLDVGVDPATGAHYLVMELLRGEDLSARLKRLGRLPPDEVVLYLQQAALALDPMHRAGIVHRDLKPGNLFRDEGDGGAPRLKILDFGVAIAAASHNASIAGTPIYMAPEQFRDGAPIGAATDVYALGMVAFTLLAGRAYWADECGGCDDEIAFALIAVRGPVEAAGARAARCGAALPSVFDAWFAHATAADAQRRFSSAGVAARALADVFGVRLVDGTAAADRESMPASLPSPPFDAALQPEQQPGGTITAAEVIARADPASRERRRTRSDRWITRKWRWVGSGLALVLVAGLAVLFQNRARASRSPFDEPRSVLACPVMRVAGLGEGAGWLGAAAASLVCERARVLLGGLPSRTRIPAELLELPGEPTDDARADVYASREARDVTLVRARGFAAYVDGTVTRVSQQFVIDIELRRGEATLARTQGRGRVLLEAVRNAMQPLIDDGLFPEEIELDPVVANFSQARDVGAALQLLDLWLAMANNGGDLQAECDKVLRLGERIGEMQSAVPVHCAYTLGLREPDVKASAPGDMSPGAVAARARLQHSAKRGDDGQRSTEILRLLAAERSSWGQSTLAATASCLLQASDSEQAVAMARRAIQAEPKNPTGESCASWIQLVTITQGGASKTSAARAMQAWLPWEGYGWLLDALGQQDSATAEEYARRAYTLSPFDTYIAGVFADKLLARGGSVEASGVQASLSSGPAPVHVLAAAALQVRVDANQGYFRRALDHARESMKIDPNDTGWARVERFKIAWDAFRLAQLLGEPISEIADRIVTQFVLPKPAPLDGGHFDVPMLIPALCARTSARVTDLCFQRFRALRDMLSGGILLETDHFTDGAACYAHGDLACAVRHWRSLLQDPAPYAAIMFEAMVDAFEHAGEPEVVERLIASVPDTAELHGVNLALVRKARWAAAHGKIDEARRMAARIIDAWSMADEIAPAVAEMSQIAAAPQ